MKSYKVYEVEEKMSAKGNAYKKLVLQEPGAKFPIKNVTMFASHPLFEDIAAGQTQELEIKEEDSGTPNPNAPGKNYINRTVTDPNATPKAPSKPAPELGNTSNAEVMNYLRLGVMPILRGVVS